VDVGFSNKVCLKPLEVDSETARRFMRRALMLDTPASTVGPVINHLGYLQIDPINVCVNAPWFVILERSEESMG
jgi:uncharacterized protein YcaQ